MTSVHASPNKCYDRSGRWYGWDVLDVWMFCLFWKFGCFGVVLSDVVLFGVLDAVVLYFWGAWMFWFLSLGTLG